MERRGTERRRALKITMQLISASVKHAYLDGISHKMSCRLLKQLETNCYEIPPRDI